MRKTLTLFALLVVFMPRAICQVAARDSMLKLIQHAKEDTAAVKLYLAIGENIKNNDPKSARGYYHRAVELSKKLGFTHGQVQGLISYGGSFIVESMFDSMLYYSRLALPLARQSKDSLEIGIALFNMGIAYRDLSDFENAILYCLQGRAIMEAKGNKRIEMQMNNALQILYQRQTEYDKAIVFGEKAIQEARELKFKPVLAESLINMSVNHQAKNLHEKARADLEEALQLGIDLQDNRIQAYALMDIGGIYLQEGNFEQVKKIAPHCLELQKKVGSQDGEAHVYRGLAVCYLQEKNYAKAKEYAQKAAELNAKTGNIREQSNLLRLVSCISYAERNMAAGFKYDMQSDSILQKMVGDALSEKSANLEKKYETERKENRIRQLEVEKKVQELSIRQKSTLNYILTAGAAVLLLLGLLLYRNYRQKQRLQRQRISELETEKRLTATEAVLKGEEQERTRLARELHDGLGGMLSGIKFSFMTIQGNMFMTPENVQAFERSMDMLDSSIQEMRRVAHNMMPEALVKFGLDTAIRDFCHDVTKSGALQVNYLSQGLEDGVADQTKAITIYRIVQELLNNIMKHAGAQMAIVQVIKTNMRLTVTVEDDGKGFDTRNLDHSGGIGWSNIRNRVEFLNGEINVQSELGKGVSVLIELPI
ncbi:tetratricopeptide repeat protein [Flavitalea sp. BT771]|uniref:tetratricopeptide repeat-containing sensor histidine kinase n=1 Tax=Flavitalea sp. BT771 TaxID=3063329 RepID=UPI0026E39B46|nr:tetratricopeptide repeat protein [Flavitalea sp. BT771]MDO6429034.1 tetratricopeptide repeat protein [Flavitalea sp. BT771]MDV6218838.1 tetratricopeptide repeat protein [Flavitalea sp. BT771]